METNFPICAVHRELHPEELLLMHSIAGSSFPRDGMCKALSIYVKFCKGSDPYTHRERDIDFQGTDIPEFA